MPVIVRNAEAALRTDANGCVVRSLLSRENTGSDHIVLEHVELKGGAEFEIVLDSASIGWLQVLDGAGQLAGSDDALDTRMIAYLPCGYHGNFAAGARGTMLLVAVVPDAARFDESATDFTEPPRAVDWTREPVLQSEHDARKRVYMATPGLTGTEAFKGEMITYPPATAAPEHHHEGAEHFQYVIAGSGTALLEGTPHTLRVGDVLYNFERERHAFMNESDSDFVFVEFFVPGPCKTVWSPGANVCAWLPTGVDTSGRPPARDIGYHVHGNDDGI